MTKLRTKHFWIRAEHWCWSSHLKKKKKISMPGSNRWHHHVRANILPMPKGQKRQWITYSASAATWSTSRQLSETTSYCHTVHISKTVTIEWSLPALGTFRLEEFRPHYALSPGGKDIGRSLQKNRSPQTYWLWKRQWSSGHGTCKDTGFRRVTGIT